MDTPIVDFLRQYRASGTSRLHMPGHKGSGPLGFEDWDITEIKGADSLYEAEGIIAKSEENAATLFGARRTFYSAEGSSQCIRAMLALALTSRPRGRAPVVLAPRNVHKTFLYAAAALDLRVEWLWPEGERRSLCACPVTGEGLERALSALSEPPIAVYVTSPDYLGGMASIGELAQAAHRHGTLLLVDNAHGAYLHFLEKPCHPLDLGADLCCDSAHKTLPVLTGGAYLHIGKNAPQGLEEGAKEAMALFGSTSPSYLILASLDACNAALAGEEPRRIQAAAQALSKRKEALLEQGWALTGEEPLKLTIDGTASGLSGPAVAQALRAGGVEPEYVDRDYVVLMASGSTTQEDLKKVEKALGAPCPTPSAPPTPPMARGERVLSIREALLSPKETVPVEQALGRILAAPTVSCPPAVPILVCGERVEEDAIRCFRYYGRETCTVVAQ